MLMYLKEVPQNFYRSLQEVEFELVPDTLYMAMVIMPPTNEKENVQVKYLFRIVTDSKVHESMITQQLYEEILSDPELMNCKSRTYSKFEYLYGKDTITVYSEKVNDEELFYADGPKDNKEWQYDFHKYHI